MTALPTRRIGPLTVSSIGLGCMNLSHAYLPRPEAAEAVRLVHQALDAGVTMLDTAALYGFGANEELIGRALAGRRNGVVLASKCVLAEIDGKRGLDGSPDAIAKTLDAALGRLKTDHIDLYYLHRLDRAVPIEESVGALVRALEAGKIGAIGLSEMSAATIRRAGMIHPIAAVQTEYSPLARNAEIAVLDCCEELDIGFIAFSPLGRGLLADAVAGESYLKGDLRASLPRFNAPHIGRNRSLARQLAQVALEADCTPAQLTLAWILSRRPFVVPIPGTTSASHLHENVETLHKDISEEMLAAVDAIFPVGAVSGPRYPADAQAQVDTEIWPDEDLA